MTTYQQAKNKLISHAEWVKVRYSDDKPAIMESINEYTHMLTKDFDLPEWQKNLLHNYAAKLHP
jgi:hypothetical protein